MYFLYYIIIYRTMQNVSLYKFTRFFVGAGVLDNPFITPTHPVGAGVLDSPHHLPMYRKISPDKAKPSVPVRNKWHSALPTLGAVEDARPYEYLRFIHQFCTLLCPPNGS